MISREFLEQKGSMLLVCYFQFNLLMKKIHCHRHTVIDADSFYSYLLHTSFNHQNRPHIALLMLNVTFCALDLCLLQLLALFITPQLSDAPHNKSYFYSCERGSLQIIQVCTAREGHSFLS